MIALLPNVGHPRSDLIDDPALRFWSVYSYLIAFLPEQRPLLIVRILHGSRSPEELRAELQDPRSAESDSAGPAG